MGCNDVWWHIGGTHACKRDVRIVCGVLFSTSCRMECQHNGGHRTYGHTNEPFAMHTNTQIIFSCFILAELLNSMWLLLLLLFCLSLLLLLLGQWLPTGQWLLYEQQKEKQTDSCARFVVLYLHLAFFCEIRFVLFLGKKVSYSQTRDTQLKIYMRVLFTIFENEIEIIDLWWWYDLAIHFLL